MYLNVGRRPIAAVGLMAVGPKAFSTVIMAIAGLGPTALGPAAVIRPKAKGQRPKAKGCLKMLNFSFKW